MKIPSTYLPHPATRPVDSKGVAVGDPRHRRPRLTCADTVCPTCSQQLAPGREAETTPRASAEGQVCSSYLPDAITLRATQGKIFLVDLEDYALVSRFRWAACWINSGWYAKTWDGGALTSLHRLIMRAKPGEIVDHIDGNTLDCRKANMRIVDQGANSINRSKSHRPTSSQYKGVTKRRNGRWQAKIGLERKQYNLGNFATEEEGARAYDAAAVRLHGEFARLNFPEDAR